MSNLIVTIEPTQLFSIGVTLLTPVYIWLYKINLHIGIVDNVVKGCPYCNRKVEMEMKNHEQERE